MARGVGDAMDKRNQLIRLMPAADREALAPYMTTVVLEAGEILYEPEYPVEWVYLPTTAVLSVVTVMLDGRTVECDTVGYESAVGMLAALAATVAVSRTFVQIGGEAIRVSAARLRTQADHSGALRQLLIRHAYANLAQAHQSAACNALHELEQRLCKWLLMSQDRVGTDRVRLTQQYLATMLGVQRTTVTLALRDLSEKGLIQRGRGYVDILDRGRLEDLVCECYGAVRDSLARVVGHQPRASESA
jgi:CRP-like cAMP-binding protein